MQDESSVQPLISPWRLVLFDTLRDLENSLLLVSPYIKEDIVDVMGQILQTRTNASALLQVRIITRVEPQELLAGSSDITALLKLIEWSLHVPACSVEIRAIPNVHAKVWVFDTRHAIVGSGNATTPGLDGNIEYGLSITDSALIERILSDWQIYWEQATPVGREALLDLQQQLEEIMTSDLARDARKQDKMLNRKVNAVARIGRRIVPRHVALKTQQSPQIREPMRDLGSEQQESTNTEQGSTADTESLDVTFTTIPAPHFLQEPAVVAETIRIPSFHFWQALCWVLPLDKNEYGMIDIARHREAFLKLAWKPTLEPPQLQCIWADGNRYSQASLVGESNTIDQPWTATFNIERIRSLNSMWQFIKKEKPYLFIEEEHSELELFLNRNSSPCQLFITYQYHRRFLSTKAALTTPCTQAVMPGPFPVQRSPISRITVARNALQQALTVLEPHSPAVVELTLTVTNKIPSLTLSTGRIESPVTTTIPASDVVLNGPTIKLRLDFAAFHHILISTADSFAGTTLFQSWQLTIDSYAETLHFTPSVESTQNASLIWKHELRSV
jgi:hypothetical protein